MSEGTKEAAAQVPHEQFEENWNTVGEKDGHEN